jgi:N6-adenosine-specific RNA methylase IME4
MLPFHPFADIFPLIEGKEFDDLVEDVKANGLRDTIVLHQGTILDGRNRYRACLAAGLFEEGKEFEARSKILYFREFKYLDTDALSYVISKNLRRRQLNESQRAMVAAKLATMRQGARTDLAPIGAMSDAQAAKAVQVSERSVERAKSVQRQGASELQRAVEGGQLRISTAAMIARLPKDEQIRLLAEAAPQAVKAAAKEINARAREERRATVRAMHATLSEQSGPLPSNRRYPVIYADPATEFKAGFGTRSIENHYPTESIDYWCRLPVGDLALPDCLLLCWTTVPQLAATITKLLPAWGFSYKSCLCWDKTAPDHPRESATGYWVRNQHELLLIATRGSPTLPEPADVPVSMYRERKGVHSAKPDYYHELIERMTPGLPRIELFARSVRPGWTAWGNQALQVREAAE